jgi:uncharacterized protein (TIGR02145 family)
MKVKILLNIIIPLSILIGSGCKKAEIKPDINTVGVTFITPVSACCDAIMSFNGSSTISEKGICWNKEQSVSISDYKTTEIINKNASGFSGTITGLISNTKYYVRAYAVSSAGVVYGNELYFTTPVDHSGEKGTVTDIEAKQYKTIGIGSQIWMAENIRTMLLNDGSDITYGQCFRCWSFLTTPGYCWYDNFTPNKNTFGALYNWYTVNSMKLCPSGWHVPSADEWEILETFLGGVNIAAGRMIESGNSGFNALPGGYRGDLAVFLNLGESCNFWTSSSVSPERAIYRSLGFKSPEITSGTLPIGWGASVRCIKN